MSASLCLTRRGFNFPLFYPGLQIEKRTARVPSGGWMLCCSAVTHHLPICRLCLTCDFFVISERVILPLKYHSSACRLSRRLWQMKKKGKERKQQMDEQRKWCQLRARDPKWRKSKLIVLNSFISLLAVCITSAGECGVPHASHVGGN